MGKDNGCYGGASTHISHFRRQVQANSKTFVLECTSGAYLKRFQAFLEKTKAAK